ncbi:major facilitator superfamily domain-containing protein [Durotheca rogersii]|uniref:major facilitator superfamily domain-containing protein n=1 Tax=Durotheca rogersii TaxID=419775 RepID=UPI00221E706D|nr:major facilitator superfamily domain-containing protein [Durotheca rogersii]KAI5865370.1 major facilitator superfamily domain-containing protein [Durotheca rogersii]
MVSPVGRRESPDSARTTPTRPSTIEATAADDDEISRLLSPSFSRASSADLSDRLLGERDAQDGFASPLYPYTIVFVFGLVLVTGFGSSLLNTPEVRLLEMALCRDYYRTNDPSVIGPPPLSYVDEENCKVDSIQVELAYIMATRSLLSAIPGIFLTFPYGQLANKIGRRPVVLLGLLGEMLEYFWVILVCYFHEVFPTRLVLISPVFVVIGGGSKVISACIYTIITDVTPEHIRTTIFYLAGAGILLSALIAMPFGSFLLSIDLWLPYKFSTPVLLSAFPLIFAMPETMPKSSIEDEMSPERIDVQEGGSSTVHRLRAMVISLAQRLKQSLVALNPSAVRKEITLILVILFLSMFCSMTGRIFVQYTSKLLGWSISTAGYILGIRAFAALCVLFCLAGITQLLEKTNTLRPLLLDVWVVRLSFIALSVGTAFIAISRESGLLIAGSVLSSVGNGLAPAMQGLLAHFADSSLTAQVFASAALVELLAEFVGGFAFAGLFDIGIRGGQFPGIGLPFYVSAVLTLFAGALSFLLPTA